MRGFGFAKLPRGLLKTMVHIKRTGGDYGENGKYVKGSEVRTDFKGVLLPLTEKDLKYVESGTYTTSDYKLYCEVDFETNEQIEYLSKVWTIQEPRDYLEMGSFRRYIVRRVGETGESV